jgi:hypothetical protein
VSKILYLKSAPCINSGANLKHRNYTLTHYGAITTFSEKSNRSQTFQKIFLDLTIYCNAVACLKSVFEIHAKYFVEISNTEIKI